MPQSLLLVRYLATLSIFAIFSLCVAGCADTNQQPTTRPLTADQKQKQVLRDPFKYGDDDSETDISGGDIKTLDKKALKRDIDSVLNP